MAAANRLESRHRAGRIMLIAALGLRKRGNALQWFGDTVKTALLACDSRASFDNFFSGESTADLLFSRRQLQMMEAWTMAAIRPAPQRPQLPGVQGSGGFTPENGSQSCIVSEIPKVVRSSSPKRPRAIVFVTATLRPTAGFLDHDLGTLC